MSLVLTGSEVMQVLDMDLALVAVADAFRAYGEGRVNMPPKSYLTLAHGDFRAMYGEIFLPQAHICGLKWVNVHPANPAKGLLTVMAKILLNDPETGLEFADLDGTHVTDFRTGAAGGLAAKYLANPSASRLGLIGAGAQARTQVAALVKVRPIEEIVVYDRHLDHAQGFAEKLAATYGVKAWPVPTAAEAVTGMDIVVTTTPSTSPVVRRGGSRRELISTPSAPMPRANRNWSRRFSKPPRWWWTTGPRRPTPAKSTWPWPGGKLLRQGFTVPWGKWWREKNRAERRRRRSRCSTPPASLSRIWPWATPSISGPRKGVWERKRIF